MSGLRIVWGMVCDKQLFIWGSDFGITHPQYLTSHTTYFTGKRYAMDIPQA
jgi:hypothetical protein